MAVSSADFPKSHPALLREQLLSRRSHGPHLLNSVEWDAVETEGEDEGILSLAQLRRFRSIPDGEIASGEPRALLVIDVRAAQLATQNGTRTHGRNILDVALNSVPEGVEVRSLSVEYFPPLDPEFRNRFDGEWDSRFYPYVGAFFQLAPFIHDDSDTQIRLCTRPGIRTAGVWLDAIIGTYPEQFLPDEVSFFVYQFGLECVGQMDRVLALSVSSENEAIALGVEPSRIVRTGCLPGLPEVSAQNSKVSFPFERMVVIVGNGLPHKNLAVAVAGATRFMARDRNDFGIVVVANMSEQQSEALIEMALLIGIERHRIVIRGLIDDASFDSIISHAEVVIVPSLHEGFSLPVIEALTRSTPVIVSDIPAHRELLDEGRWFFDPVDPESLYRSLRSVTSHRTKSLDAQRSSLSERVDPTQFERVVSETVEWLCAGFSRPTHFP